jgi:hypothetical protein
LAAELIRRGHDVTLVPVYTPTRTDEPNMSRERVLFGGISVYLQQYVPLFRKTPWLLDRFWDSPRVIDAFAGRTISNDPRLLGDLTLSMLRGREGVLRKEFEKLLGWMRNEPLPDIINLPNSLLIALAAPLREALGRPVVCTLQGEELFIKGLISPYRERALDLIREKIQEVDCFIAVSEYCARFMSEFLRIPAGKIEVVPLGINMSGYDRGRTPLGEDTRDFDGKSVMPAPGLTSPDTPHRTIKPTWKGCAVSLRQWDSEANSRIAEYSIATVRLRFLEISMCFQYRQPTMSRKACS